MMKVKAKMKNEETGRMVWRYVSGPFVLAEAVSQFIRMYQKEHPDHELRTVEKLGKEFD